MAPPRDVTIFSGAALHAAGPTGPLYRQVATHLRQLIKDGVLPPDAPLPAERELAERLDVSRVTLRKALQNLVEEGLLDQRPRSGTFVKPVHVEQALSLLTGFTEDMRSRGLAPSSRWLSRTVGVASPDEAMALGLAAGETVSRLWRVRLADGSPIALELATIPCRFLPNPLEVTGSLYDVLRARGYAPHRALQRLAAKALTANQAELLQVPAGSPALHLERRSFLENGGPLELVRSQYRGDAYDVIVELNLASAPQPLTERRS